MRTTIDARVAWAAVLAVVMAIDTGPAEAGSVTGDFGRLAAEIVVTGRDGLRQAVISGATNFTPDTRTGTAVVTIKQGEERLARASGQFTADGAVQAATGVTALIMVLTGQDLARAGAIKITEVKFEGDRRGFDERAARIIEWWDSEAALALPGYRSPILDATKLGRLQLNVWNVEQGNEPRTVAQYATFFFDEADPTKIVAGTLWSSLDVSAAGETGNVLSGRLVDRTETAAPGDYELEFEATWYQAPAPFTTHAVLAITTLADGTVDVRGVAREWHTRPGHYVIEGVGSAKFVVPSSSTESR
jgi:hypothetical protein